MLDLRGATGVTRGTDIGYDPANNVYLIVSAHGPILGQFVDALGAKLSGVITIMDGTAYFGHLPRVTYSPHVNGGLGGFLVTWHENSYGPADNEVRGAIVSYPAGVVSPDRAISSGADGLTFWEMPAPAAYSTTSRRFLVVWTTIGWGIQGRFVDETGAPIGPVIAIENPGGARWPATAWNAVTNEFGISYCRFGATDSWAVFRRLGAADGLLSPRTSFGFTVSTYASDIAFNTATGNLVMAWSTGADVQSAAFDIGGNLIGSGLVSSFLNHSADNLGLAFNPVSRTFLVVGHSGDIDDLGVELNTNGAPNSSYTVITGGATLGSYYPRASASTVAPHWGVSFSMNLRVAAAQIVGTTSTNGGSSDPIGSIGGGSGGSGGGTPTACTTPDPFAALGGGTCVNGGWLPPGSNTGSAGGSTGGCTTVQPGSGWTCVNGGWLPPGAGTYTSGTSGGCTTPDPFASLGGGVCTNGGWLPPGSSTGSSGGSTGGCTTIQPGPAWICVNGGWLPPGSSTGSAGGSTGGCTTPDPFASLGGGVCTNGGWLPPGSSTGSSGGWTSGCTTIQPGPAWICVNGGWLPPGSSTGSTGGCTTPDPFASIGGGTCINGGWVPGSSGSTTGTGSGCTTPDPFASLGGGVCVNGGWLPPGSSTGSTGGCSTPDPFASLGGGICVNGGWIPRGMTSGRP